MAASSSYAKLGATYAAAAFDLAKETGALDALEKDLTSLDHTMTTSQDFADFVRSPILAADQKQAALAAILDKAGAHELTKKFLGIVARNNRLFALSAIVLSFKKLCADARGEINAEAISAHPLTEANVADLKTKIEGYIGKSVQLSTKVDADLLGGLIVKVGDTMIDSSLRTKLNRLQNAMLSA